MQKGLVSIVIPVYQHGKCVKHTIEAVLAQTYRPIEIIIVNDGSQDETDQICKEYALQYPEIRYMHMTHSGASAARNMGISVARGQYIQFIDADDYPGKTLTEKLVDTISVANAQMAVCSYEAREKYNRIRREYFSDVEALAKKNNTTPVYEIILSNMLSVTWNKLYITSEIKHMYDESLSMCEDSIFCIRYFLEHPNIAVCSDVLYTYNNFEKKKVSKERILSYNAFLKYYSYNQKLVDMIESVQLQKKAESFIRKVFYYGVYTYIFEGTSNADLPIKQRIAIIKNILKDSAFREVICDIDAEGMKEKTYRFLSKIQSATCIYLVVCCREKILDCKSLLKKEGQYAEGKK